MKDRSPNSFVWVDGEICSAASIRATSSGALYGKSIFTTIAIRNGEAFLWEKHWRRLLYAANKLGIDIRHLTESDTKAAMRALLSANVIRDGRARMTFFDQTGSTVWKSDESRKTSLLLMTGDSKIVPKPFRMESSSNRIFSNSELNDVKSGNYLDKLLAFEEAKRNGVDEAVRLNERGEVVSACMANLFWSKDEKLYTPSLKTGCLPGTTREFILEALECEEVEVPYDTILMSDAIFLTSAGLGVIQVDSLAGWKPQISHHPILALLLPVE